MNVYIFGENGSGELPMHLQGACSGTGQGSWSDSGQT